MNKFANPYESLPYEDKVRTTIDVAQRTHGFVLGCRGRVGTLQTSINILLEKLVTALTEHGITSFDPDAYEHAVANCTIVLPGRGTLAVAEVSRPDDRRGAEQLARNSAPAPTVPNPSVPHSDRGNKAKAKGRKAVRHS